MIKKSFILPACCLLALSAKPQQRDVNVKTLTLEQGFKEPPLSARPKALWPWTNGNVSLPQISFELEEAKRKGMAGFDIWDIGTMVDPDHQVPAGPAFLGKESVQAIAHTIREADRLDMELGLIISSSWNAGGSWIKPEHGAMGLFRRDTIVNGPQVFSSALSFPDIPGTYHGSPVLTTRDARTGLPEFYREVALIAHPLREDSIVSLSSIVDLGNNTNGAATWKVPPGKWRIVRYVCAPTGQPLAIPSPNSQGLMLDHFSAAAQRFNLDYIFTQLLPVTGSLKNRALKYLYADSYEVNSGIWTPLLPQEFKQRNDYSLIRFLPVLDGFRVGNKDSSERFLFDFTKTLSDLIIENHYRQGKEICAEQGLGFIAEAGGPGPPVHNVPFEDLKALGSLTVPRGEFWNKHQDLEILQIIKGIASASHIYNQKFVEAEAFTSVWLWQEGPDELKPLADRAMCEGLNRFVYHTFPHSPPESGFPGWVYNFGTLINTTNGWWPKSTAFHYYLARCSYLLQQGNFVGDVAFYYGDKAPNFVPPKHIDPSLGYGYDYDVVNTEILLNKMEVRHGRIYLPHGQYYEVLVLPPGIKMNPAVATKIEKMVRAGATIIGTRPELSYGLAGYREKDRLIRSIGDRLWGENTNIKEHKYGQGKVVWGKPIREALLEKGILPDVQGGDGDIDFIHRRTKNEEIYFIRNTKKRTIVHQLAFRVKGYLPELWDAEKGTSIPLPFYKETAQGITIPLSLDSSGSSFIVFRKPPKGTAPAKGFDWPADDDREIQYTPAGAISFEPGMWTHYKPSRIPQSLALNNPWYLSFEEGKTGVARDTMQRLVPLNESQKEAVKYYSGNVTYKTVFSFRKDQLDKDQRMLLDLGRVKEIAEIYVNGVNLGVCWHAPFRVDITDALVDGDNLLQVEVVNTINNRLIGDARLPAQYRKMHSNITKLPNAWQSPFADAPLLEAGLIGPVEIKTALVINGWLRK